MAKKKAAKATTRTRKKGTKKPAAKPAPRKAKGAKKTAAPRQSKRAVRAVLGDGPLRKARPSLIDQSLPGFQPKQDAEMDRLHAAVYDERISQAASLERERHFEWLAQERMKKLGVMFSSWNGVEFIRAPQDEKFRVRIVDTEAPRKTKGKAPEDAEPVEAPADVVAMDADDAPSLGPVQ